jgi:hypothetical protein
MAISTIQPTGFYDANRDIYYDDARRHEYERVMHYRRQEEEYRRMQNNAYYADSATLQQGKIVNPTPKQDPKDPLAFLTKTDNKILLTGEAT